MKIYTITLNPAYDVHAYTDELNLHKENLVKITLRQAGGKGVNISRALTAVGVENTAIVVIGRNNAEEFKAELEASGMNCIYIERNGVIRDNLTVHEKDNKETRISFEGFSIDASVFAEIEEKIDADENTIVTFTGSLPKGISVEEAKAFLKRLRAKNVKIVLDSKSFGKEDIFDVEPWLIKPNAEEMTALLGVEAKTQSEAIEQAQVFSRKGVKNVIASLAEKGAVLCSGNKTYRAVPPPITKASSVGAGDSMVAGFISAFITGQDKSVCLKNAVAFGSAACLREGTKPPKPEDINLILQKTAIH